MIKSSSHLCKERCVIDQNAVLDTTRSGMLSFSLCHQVYVTLFRVRDRKKYYVFYLLAEWLVFTDISCTICC